MWVKITSIEQLSSLHPGSTIAIHPLQGPPRDIFDETDPDQVSHRLVSENDTANNMISTISLQRKEEARTVTSAGMGSMMLGNGAVDYAVIIEHSNWWMPIGM